MSTNTAIQTTETVVPFSEARRAMIATLKAFITDKGNMRPPRDEYGYRRKIIKFSDYVVYAALRGADIRKTSHMEGGENAIEALQSAKGGSYMPYLLGRHLKDEAHLEEYQEILKDELAKYL